MKKIFIIIICSILVVNSCNSAEKPNENKSEVKEAPLNKLIAQQKAEGWRERVDKSKFSEYPDFGLAKEGHIALQDHGQQLCFLSIKILEL